MARHLNGPVVSAAMQCLEDFATTPGPISDTLRLEVSEYRALCRGLKARAYALNIYPYPMPTVFICIYNAWPDSNFYLGRREEISYLLDWFHNDPTMNLPCRLTTPNRLPDRKTKR